MAQTLPLVPFLPRIASLLDTRRALVLTASPAAGKSTLVPPFLMGCPWLGNRRIVMLEPRRLAACAVAGRIAELLGERVGQRAGYAVRGAVHVSRETRIEVVTEALLTRRIQDDPLLEGVGVVILDEFHERSLHADLALALALEVQRARPDLALLVMSATLDAEAVARVLGGKGGAAAVVDCPGTGFPVKTAYRPLAGGGSAGYTGGIPAGFAGRRWEDGFAEGVADMLRETTGDILAFLPGAAEIRRVGERLGAMRVDADVLPLHGMMSLDEQQRVVRPIPGGPRRVILATSIAETSLTVPGVGAVADAGLSRISRLHIPTGLDRLVTERVSAASADQRRGRAGRLGPGMCVRFWAEGEPLAPRADPEILRSDLSGLVLECALWGANEPDALRWMDCPPRVEWDRARDLLRMLGLLAGAGRGSARVPVAAPDIGADSTERASDDSGIADSPTDLGRGVAGLGLPPRLGVLAHEGLARGLPRLAAACAAVLADRDGSGIAGDPDFRLRLEALRTGTGNPAWRAAALRETERILRRLGAPPERAAWSPAQEQAVGGLLAHAFPDRIARREADGSYRFVTGRVARFPGGTRVGGPARAIASRAADEWIVAPETDAGDIAGTIRMAAPVERAEAERALVPMIEERTSIRWDGLVPGLWRVRWAGRMILSERPGSPEPEAAAASFRERLAHEGTAILPWGDRSRELLARMRMYARSFPDRGIGELTEQALVARSGEWLSPRLLSGKGPVIDEAGLVNALRGLLKGCRADFEREAPESIVLPTGGRRRLDYSGDAPAVEARIQEVFGLARSPLVCGVPLTFRLLSPAGRPLQITRDLAGFWAGSYAEVRREMRGRYPKHPWPENPLAAKPTTRAKPRK